MSTLRTASLCSVPLHPWCVSPSSSPFLGAGEAERHRGAEPADLPSDWLPGSWLGYKRDPSRLRSQRLRGFWPHLCRTEATVLKIETRSPPRCLSLLAANPTAKHDVQRTCRSAGFLPEEVRLVSVTGQTQVLHRLSSPQWLACFAYEVLWD